MYGIFNIFNLPYIPSAALSILLIMLIVNSFNLIDGIDGLAATTGIIVNGTFALLFMYLKQYELAAICLAMVGATAGFLRYNVTPAKIFMGDTGSFLTSQSTDIPGEIIWMDLLNPTTDEKEFVQSHAHVRIPSMDALSEIEIGAGPCWLLVERGARNLIVNFDQFWEDFTTYIRLTHASGRDRTAILAPRSAPLLYDFPAWLAQEEIADPTPFRLPEPRVFEFCLTPDAQEELDRALQVWTTHIKGLSKLVTRIKVDSQVRQCIPRMQKREPYSVAGAGMM